MGQRRHNAGETQYSRLAHAGKGRQAVDRIRYTHATCTPSDKTVRGAGFQEAE